MDAKTFALSPMDEMQRVFDFMGIERHEYNNAKKNDRGYWYLEGPNIPVSKSTKQKAYKPILPESKAWLLNFYAKPDAILRAMFPEVDFKWTSGGANGGVSGRRRERRSRE
mmetsp:Transcript_19845/g.51984  ORF Transcript_19845/g.51984 Transcript_19845/m.51984 type:complete len:111 (-) Transcript_19845:30-362(-)